jgi:hypothetical protein
MEPKHCRAAVAISVALAAGTWLAAVEPPSPSAQRMATYPGTMLWAWERPEDLSFLRPRDAGVAFLAKTVVLSADGIAVRPRMQLLRVVPGTALMAVVRLESDAGFRRLAREADQGKESPVQLPVVRVAEEIAAAGSLPGILGVQVDYDATESEREFYRDVLRELRARLPKPMPISITALASWCYGDPWLDPTDGSEDSPLVDEAVPMLFRMGPDHSEILRRLAAGKDFRAPVCRTSAGYSTDEPMPRIAARRRGYIFHPRAWTPEAAQGVLGGTR